MHDACNRKHGSPLDVPRLSDDDAVMMSCTGDDIKWNFGKFLISNNDSVKRCLPCLTACIAFVLLGGNGRVRAGPLLPARMHRVRCQAQRCLVTLQHPSRNDGRYEPTTSPKAILPDIEAAILVKA